MPNSSANRVAVNSLVQYCRLIINIIVSLFSVRVVLNSLGASDYGAYDVIAGVIGLLGFINASLNQTSIRYLSVSLGKEDINETRTAFNNCFWLHFIIAITLSAILEFIGSFLFQGSLLNIPNDRINAASIVYHCMTVSVFFQIAITPFSALIISHEKFLYLAIVSIIDSLLKLAIAFVILYISCDKLILYGELMTFVTIINSALYIAYVFIKYQSNVLINKPSWTGILSQSSFAGWTLLDVLGSVATRQGYAIMLNRFFGTTTNAVFALSRQVEGQLYYISASVIDSIKPQIMKSFGANDRERAFRLSLTAGKMGFSMMSLVAIPLLVYMPEVLSVWLKNVPDGTVLFTRLLVAACMSEQLTRGLVYACQATGRIKWFSIIVSTIRFTALPISILFLHICAQPCIAIIVFFVCETIGSFSRVFVMSKLENLSITVFFKEVFLGIAISFSAGILLCMGIKTVLPNNLISFIISSSLSLVTYSVIVYCFSLTTIERQSINSIYESLKNRLIHK